MAGNRLSHHSHRDGQHRKVCSIPNVCPRRLSRAHSSHVQNCRHRMPPCRLPAFHLPTRIHGQYRTNQQSVMTRIGHVAAGQQRLDPRMVMDIRLIYRYQVCPHSARPLATHPARQRRANNAAWTTHRSFRNIANILTIVFHSLTAVMRCRVMTGPTIHRAAHIVRHYVIAVAFPQPS